MAHGQHPLADSFALGCFSYTGLNFMLHFHQTQHPTTIGLQKKSFFFPPGVDDRSLPDIA